MSTGGASVSKPEARLVFRVHGLTQLMCGAFLATLLLLSGSLPLQAQTFFRVSASGQSSILGLERAGYLRWTNSAPTGSYSIECSSALRADAWHPYCAGLITNPVTAIRVEAAPAKDGFRLIPGGRFTMGDVMNDPMVMQVSRPVHTATVSPFYLEPFEFSNRQLCDTLQWAVEHQRLQVVDSLVTLPEHSTNALLYLGRYDSEITYTNGQFKLQAGREHFPAVWVTWFGAVALCNFRSEMEGLEPVYDLATFAGDPARPGYRLPSEAEWELAARGGHSGHRFPWADSDLITHARANYQSDTNTSYDVSPTREFHPDYANFRPRTSPVGVFAPNDFGLFDMAGNVWEWTGDWHGKYPAKEQVNPTGPETGTTRVFRGGSWLTKSERVTCAMRYPYNPVAAFDDIGLRMARSCLADVPGVRP